MTLTGDDPRHPGRGVPELFDELGDRIGAERWRPAIDVFETEKSVVVRVELAGVRSGDLEVSIEGDDLRIAGVRRPPEEGGVERLHHMEIAFGAFERAVRIATPFDRDGVQAHLADGFLRVTLPKRVPGARRIEVQR